MFLECDGELALSPEWNALKPSHSSVLEGVAKLPKQIMGKHLELKALFCIQTKLSFPAWSYNLLGTSHSPFHVHF